MPATVWMRHPTLPPEQLIEVPEISIPHHQAAGWEITDAPAKPQPAPRKAAAAEEAAPPQEAANESAAQANAAEGPAADAEAPTPPKRPRKTAPKAEES
ncbi:hypothetical protein KMT30_07865 [Streptomyces sp. IBSBF 2953]|nr:hypothetical protein [Streptomyces hayashii]